MTSVSSRPTAATFHLPIVYLLGKLSGWKAYVSVVPSNDVLDDALRLAGIDPIKTTLPLTGREGLYRRVRWAVRNQCRLYCGQQPALTTILDENHWALTAQGLTEAKRLRAQYEGQIQLAAGPNLTAKWIQDNYMNLYSRLHSYLDRKMPVSKERASVDDHIQTFFMNLINRDGLRTRIEEGKSIPYSQVCAWARRSAYSECRDNGTEPICRVMDGALTKKELDKYNPMRWTFEVTPHTINHGEFLNVNSYTEHSEDDPTGCPMDFLADETNVEAEVLDEDAFHAALRAISTALHAEITAERDPDFHEQLFRERFLEGLTVKEIAQKHGIDQNQATVAIGRIRKAVSRHRAELQAEFIDVF